MVDWRGWGLGRSGRIGIRWDWGVLKEFGQKITFRSGLKDGNEFSLVSISAHRIISFFQVKSKESRLKLIIVVGPMHISQGQTASIRGKSVL